MLAHPQLTQQERDKLEIDPDFDFREIAARDLKDISKNEIGMFKWSGVYHQLQTGYFMMRLRMPGGMLTSKQLQRAGELAVEFSQNELCITTRQCLQYHWLRKNDIYKVIEGMEATGITITNACGDVVRNVTSCSGMGVCQHEMADTAAMMQRIADDPEMLELKRNLPRKHKITVAGCNAACGMMLMNCQSWVPANKNGDWIYYAGGGLGRIPYLAKKIFDKVPEDLVVAVTRAGVEAHNRYGDRRQRRYARLKIVVDRFGPKGYAALIINLMHEAGVSGTERIIIAEDSTPNVAPVPFVGESVLPQQQSGLNSIRVIIKRSEISGDEAIYLAKLATKFGNGEIMFTQRQNLELRGVKDNQVESLQTLLREAGYRLKGLDMLPDIVSCVGTTMCNLAVSDTPNAYKHIMTALADNEELMEQVGPLRINMNGCPNSCAHHWIADIGLRGCRINLENGSEEGFSVFVGGKMDGAGAIGQFLITCTANDIAAMLINIFTVYLENRRSGADHFNDFANRIGTAEFKLLLEQQSATASIEQVSKRNLMMRAVFEQVVNEA
jgi:sulfite reductase beta subunit-like hemoprotein